MNPYRGVSEGPLSTPRYSSPRERALAETATEWMHFDTRASSQVLEAEAEAWWARRATVTTDSTTHPDPFDPSFGPPPISVENPYSGTAGATLLLCLVAMISVLMVVLLILLLLGA